MTAPTRARGAVRNPLRPALFHFLAELREHNDRRWFHARRQRFEEEVRGPALAFVEWLQTPLMRVSPYLCPIPCKAGGSFLRLERDARFLGDRPPYAPRVGLYFPHEATERVPLTPGAYLHLEPGNVYVRIGLWNPKAPTAWAVREHIVFDPDGWTKATRSRRFSKTFALGGRSLKRPPKFLDPEHPLIADLMRRDFVASAELSQTKVTAPDFHETFVEMLRTATPLMAFLCKVLQLPY